MLLSVVVPMGVVGHFARPASAQPLLDSSAPYLSVSCDPTFDGSFGLWRLPLPPDGSSVIPAAGIQPIITSHIDRGGAPWVPARKGYVDSFCLDFLARGYYLNDQRIQWSGLECTFGAEAAVAPVVQRQFGCWVATIEGEFFINQPFDRNVLVDTPERQSYAGTFEVDTLEISKLSLALRKDDCEIALGKIRTPFGRTYFPLFSNARFDAPFIRTESILWRETGLLLRYDPGLWVCEAAVVNGSEDGDTNSSKGLVSRVGLEAELWAAGVSVKVQDGIGSEDQKTFNNHVGADAMMRCGRFTFSGEVIYDEYGLRKSGFDPNDITWRRSIYYRDLNLRDDTPLTGVGYYASLDFQQESWAVGLNYGGFYPQEMGDPRHDEPTRRGIVKVAYGFAPGVGAYAVVILENEGHMAQGGRPRKGSAVLTGMQYTF